MVLKRKMLKNKKGMFFTILVLSLLSLFLVVYTSYSIIQTRDVVKKRVNTLNNFVFSVEENLPRNLYIAGFRIIFLVEKRIVETGSYITDFNSVFQEAFFNKTIYGQEQILMDGASFADIENSLQDRASEINADINFSSPVVSITQEDPWHVKIRFASNLTIKDKGGLASWNRSYVAEADVPIQGFEDPLYLLSTNGKVTNKINKTIYETFVEGEDVSNLLSHVENSYYIASETAPSFLDRLQGINQANENGIESLVYLPELSTQGISIKEKSGVDYIYFSDNNPSSQPVSGMPSWFRLDTEHLSVYGA